MNMRTRYAHELLAAWHDIAKVFVALGDEQRQRILLSFERGENLNVTQIAAASTLSRPAVSHHLKILREAGVLCSRKKGKEVFFWVNKSSVQSALQRALTYIDNEA